MAQNNFINVSAGTAYKDGSFGHQPTHASASASDLTLSWDSTKFTSRRALLDSLKKLEQFINSRTDIPA